jgi:DNA invertase Pin-like site-specific DNA recombinase
MIVDGYVRVSQVRGRQGLRFISPLDQREQIDRWAKAHDAQVAEVFEELDESGARHDRPLLLKALERVERGDTNGIVVARLDRFGRSLVDGLAAIERIRLAGGSFVSVQDGFDIRTPTGKLVLRIMLSMAEFDLDRMRANWATARSHAIARGEHMGPRPPLGYWREENRHLLPDPAVAPYISEVFRRRAAGASLNELVRFLRHSGVRTGSGREFWHYGSVVSILTSRTYRGELRSGEFANLEAHEPLVDELTWQLAQTRRAYTPFDARQPSLLASMARCASCRYALGVQNCRRRNGETMRFYICGKVHTQGRCPAPCSVKATRLDGHVESAFFHLLEHPPADLALRREEVRRREARFRVAEAALAGFRDDPRVIEVLGQDQFVLGLRARTHDVDQARRELSFARAALEEPPIPPLPELRRTWPELPTLKRRLYISRAIDCVFVRPGHGLEVEERAYVCHRGTGPDDLPKPGRPVRPIAPFQHPEQPGWWKQHWHGTQRLWTEHAIESELRRFLAGRPEWPPASDFKRSGQALLLDAVYRRGGAREWARRMGVAYRERRRG